MDDLPFDLGGLYAVLVGNELVFGYDAPLLSMRLGCSCLECKKNGIALNEGESGGPISSRNWIRISDGVSYIAMHDCPSRLIPLNGSKITAREDRDGYGFICQRGEERLVISLSGSCRCEGSTVFFRRGETRISLSPPIMSAGPSRCGFERESRECLSLIGERGDLTPESELLPLLLLVWGMKNAYFDPSRAEKINKRIASMTASEKETANAVLHRYYRAFGKEKR